MKLRALGMAVLAAVALAACSDSGDDDGTAQLRVGNLSPDALVVDIYVDDELVAEGVGYFEGTGYFEVPSGLSEITVTVADDPGTILLDDDVTLNEGTYYTVAAADFVDDMRLIVLTDDNTPPSSGDFQLRAVNASPSAGPVDVYITTPGLPLDEATPVVQGLVFGSASPYIEAVAGTYQVQVTTANTTVVKANLGNVVFGAGQIRTLLIGDLEGGGAEEFYWALLDELN